jgi:putative ABC transport system permease protein
MTYEDNDALDVTFPTDYLLGFPAYEAAVDEQFDTTIYVKLAEGVSPDEGRRAIETVTDDFPIAEVQDQTELKEAQGDQIDQFILFVNVLLLLAIIIAGIGIMNTLALSVYERTRELGLLRAVGAYRSQLRSAIRWEAVIIALLGAFLGLAIGVFFGWILVQALEDEGFTVFRIPWTRMFLVTLTAGLLGVAAAIPPTIRASRLNVLDAIESE